MNVEYYELRSKNSPSNSLGATGFREWCVVPAVWDKVKFIIALCFPKAPEGQGLPMGLKKS